MFVRVLSYLIFAQIFPCGVFLGNPVFAQQPSSDPMAGPPGTTESIKVSETSSLVDLDIYISKTRLR